MIFVFAGVAFCFGAWLGILAGGIMAANTHAAELEAAQDDAYADGYLQRVDDERAGIQRLPHHRP